MYVCLLLLLRQHAEETDLLFGGGFPLVVRLEGVLEVRFYVDIECLRLDCRVRGIVNTGHRARRAQVMQIAGKFREFGASILFLTLMLILKGSSVVIVEFSSNFFVLKTQKMLSLNGHNSN